jgi:glycosyltransferase involved in cell wall biosynthesis
MRVCYFGQARADYPRHRVISRGLRRLGVEVVECFVSHRLDQRDAQRALQAAFAQLEGRFDALLVAEFNHPHLLFAQSLARFHRLPIVYDFFVSLYDSTVNDRGQVKAFSPRALQLWLLDFLAAQIPDHVLVDTASHRRYYAQLCGLNVNKCTVVPVGFDDEVFTPAPPPPPSDNLRILFYGSFIPLHGADVIVRAAQLAAQTEPALHLTLIGDGQTLESVKAEAAQATNITFLPPVPFAELPTWIANSDVVLGIFGNTQKTQRVVPNKLYQGLAVGRPLISGDTPAVREFFSPGDHLLTVPVGSPQALFESLIQLKQDPSLRLRLAEQGHRQVIDKYSPTPIGQVVLTALQKAVGRL